MENRQLVVALVLGLVLISTSQQADADPAPSLHIRVNQTDDWVDATTTLGATVGITVTDAAGAVKGTASGVALREDGAVWAGDFVWDVAPPDIVVGDRVDGASSDGSVAAATVITITGQVDTEICYSIRHLSSSYNLPNASPSHTRS